MMHINLFHCVASRARFFRLSPHPAYSPHDDSICDSIVYETDLVSYGDTFGAACTAVIIDLIVSSSSRAQRVMAWLYSCLNSDGEDCSGPLLGGGGGATTHPTPAPGVAQGGAPPAYGATAREVRTTSQNTITSSRLVVV